MDENQVFGWDDTGTTAEDVSFEVLPEGEYDFEVRNVKNQRYDKKNPESKIPENTPYANVQLYCRNGKAAGTVFDRLYLYTGGLGRVTSFYKAVGLLPADTPANSKMPASFKELFDRSVTMTGRVKLTIRTYKQDGKDCKSNNVHYIIPDAQPSQPSYQPQQQTYAAPQQVYQQPMQQPMQPQQQSWGGNWG